MTLYMEVTRDKYELPLAVADTLRELASMRNTNPSTICKSINHGKDKRGLKYVKIEIEDE